MPHRLSRRNRPLGQRSAQLCLLGLKWRFVNSHREITSYGHQPFVSVPGFNNQGEALGDSIIVGVITQGFGPVDDQMTVATEAIR